MGIMMRGNGRVEQYKGNIVGFSNRLNTILVPQSFMKWANENFAPNAEAQPARLIIEVSNPADSAIASYFQKKGYDNGYGMCVFIEMPFIEFDVDKLIGNRLKKHICGKMNTGFLHSQSC